MYTLFNTSIVHVRIKFRLLAISHRQSPRARSFAFTSTRYLGPRRPLLTTLHPPHLTSSDFQCLSGKQQHHLPSSTNKNKSCTQVHYKHSQGSFVRFPEHAQGFFYLHPGPPHAPVAGELRFRTVPSQDPADFSSGHDLLDANYALPWRIPLPAVLTRASYGAFADLLMRKPSPAMLSIIAEIEEDRLPIVDQDATIMHSIGQPLYADLQKGQVHFRIAKGVDINPTVVIHLFRDQRRSKSPKGWHYPYTGSSRLTTCQLYTVT
jgi:hypothetical protein